MDVLQQILAYVGAFITGGFAVSLFDAWHSGRSEKASRRADYLWQQLQQLYGPIHFLIGQNSEIFRYHKTLGHGYDAEYAAPEKSAAASDTDRKNAMQVISVMNQFTNVTVENNRKIVDIMVANYALIDLQDVQEFQKFTMHVLRQKVEFAPDQWALPFALFKHVGNIHTYYPDFPELVARRFTEKAGELAKLRGSKSTLQDAPGIAPSGRGDF